MVKKSVIREIFDKAPKDAINLGLGQLPYDMPENLNSLALKVLLEEKIQYTPNAGLYNSRSAIANQYDNVKAEQVVITNGAEEALYASLQTLLSSGDEILIPDPGFSAYESIIKMFGASPVVYSLNEFRDYDIDVKRIRDKITPNTKAIIINNPNNPTGTIINKESMKKLIDLAHDNNIYIISDEIYRDLYLKEYPYSVLDFTDKHIVISGLSKSHCMTGWRIGWVIAPQDLAEKITVSHQYISTCANYIGQRLIEEAFNSESKLYQRELRVKLRLNFKLVSEMLINRLSYEAASAPYLFINIGEDGYLFAEKLLTKGVIVIPGVAFSQRLTNYIRISYSCEYQDLKRALYIIVKEL